MLGLHQDQNLLFNRLLTHIPLIVYSYSNHEGGSYYSPAVKDILGYSIEELLESPRLWHDSIHEDDLGLVDKSIAEAETGKAFDIQYRIQSASGDWLIFRDKSIHITCKKNKLIRIDGMVQDITMQIQSERAQSQNEKLLLSIAENYPHSYISIIEKDFSVGFTSGQEFKNNNLNPNDFIGFKVDQVFGDQSDLVRSYYERTFNGEECTFELFINDQYQLYKTVPLFSDKKDINQILVVAENITVRKLAQIKNEALSEQIEQTRKMDAIGQLAGGIAHDFNNLLGGILNATQLLESPERNLDPKGQKYVSLIKSTILRASELTTKLLSFSRKDVAEANLVDIHKIIDDVVHIFSFTFDKKIRISRENRAGNSIISGNASELQNAIMNIGINASHAMKGGGELLIATKNEVIDRSYCDDSAFDIAPGEYIRIEIADNGIGMSHEILNKIFEPFFTTRSKGGGTGLGLSSVYACINNHNGEITVASEPGAGSAFSILIPCSRSSEIHMAKDHSLSLDKGKILLIDDEEIIRFSCKDLLEELGFKVDVAASGKAGVEKYKSDWQKISLVILDMIMPDMSGLEVLKKMKEINEEIVVIVASGYTDREDIIALKAMGISAILNKPYTKSDMSEAISNVFRNTP